MVAGPLICAQSLYISKVACPSDEKTNGKFVTLFNATNQTIDFDVNEYYLVRETNGGGTYGNKKLVGKIEPNSSYVVAGKTAFKDVFGKEPNCVAGCVTGNGNDAYFLYKDGNESTGVLIDIYGQANTDGTGLIWDYTNSLAERNTILNSRSPIWDFNEWTIAKDKIAGAIDPWSATFTPTSFGAIQQASSFDVYPNPTKNIINLISEKALTKVDIYNTKGSLVQEINCESLEYFTIDMAPFQCGIYYLQIKISDNNVITKMIIRE